jgi:hypothetical protein
MTRYRNHDHEIQTLHAEWAAALGRDADAIAPSNVIPMRRSAQVIPLRPLSFPRRREPRTPDGRVDQRRLTRLALQGLGILAGGAALGIAIGAGLVWALLALAQLVGNGAALTGWAG